MRQVQGIVVDEDNVSVETSGWFVSEGEAKDIYVALTHHLLIIPDTPFRSRLCSINRVLKDHFKKEKGGKA